MPLNLSATPASLASGWRSPNSTYAPPSPSSSHTRRLEIKILCLEEQLHKLGDGIHPEVGELLEEVTRLKTQHEMLGSTLKREQEESASKDQAITKLKNSLIERDARLLTLQEEDTKSKTEVHRSIEALKAALVDKTNALVASRKEAEAARASLSTAEDAVHALKRAHSDEVEGLRASLAVTLTEESETGNESQQLQAEAAHLRELCANLQAKLEATTVATQSNELQMRAKRLEEACGRLEVQNNTLVAELDAKEGEMQSRFDAVQRDALAGFNRRLEDSINETDEKWMDVVNTIREDIQACNSEIRLVTSREARKAGLLQDYHVALTLMEEERDELLKRLAGEELSEDDSVRSFH